MRYFIMSMKWKIPLSDLSLLRYKFSDDYPSLLQLFLLAFRNAVGVFTHGNLYFKFSYSNL